MAKYKPNLKAEKLTIKRGSDYEFSLGWKVPGDATKEQVDCWKKKKGKKVKEQKDNPHLATALFTKVRLNFKDVKSKKEPIDVDKESDVSTTSATIDLDDFKPSKGTYKGKTLTRKSFYPCTSNVLSGIVFAVYLANNKGKGKAAAASYAFKLPEQPKVSIEYDDERGVLTAKIKTPEGTDEAERYDTAYRVIVKNGNGALVTVKDWASTTETDFEYEFNATTSKWSANYSKGEYLVFTCYAYARGFAGDNPAKNKAVSASYTIAAPGKAQIGAITVSDKESATGSIRVAVTPGARTGLVQLERRHGDSGSWEEVDGASFSGLANALYDTVGLAAPVKGEKLWYRIISTKDNLTTVSDPVWAEALYTEAPSASTSIECTEVRADDDGKAATALFAWDGEPNVPGQSGVEVSWSESADAWESTDQPSTFDAEWEDDQSQVQGHAHSLSIHIKGLSEGKTTYVRGRKYDETEAGRQFSVYSAINSVTPATKPASVSLEAPSYVRKGEPIPLIWTFTGDSTQTEYHVFSEQTGSTPIAEGTDASGSASISPAMYGNASQLDVYVKVGAGGDLAESVPHQRVGIVASPVCIARCSSTITSKAGAEFSVYSSSDNVRLVCQCVSNGVSASNPSGDNGQFAGDMVWTDTVLAAWSETTWQQTPVAGGRTGAAYAAEIAIPQDTALVDGGTYTLHVKAVDMSTGLQSEESACTFAVAWSHQAPLPSDDIDLDVDNDARTVTVTLAPPTGAASTDLYDVYRGTASGYDLIASSLAQDAVFTDRFPTFSDGEIGYRIAVRTEDGDTAWAEYFYELTAEVTRFDWPGGFAEFDKSLTFQDSWKKSFSKRPHSDGSIGGAFNLAIERTGSYSAKLIKGRDSDAMHGLMAMAEYPGTVYCRRPDGHAFECNVDIGLDNRHWSMLADPSFTVDRVTLSEEFMVGPEDIVGGIVPEAGE